jgi:predicted nucleic acid-binding protein
MRFIDANVFIYAVLKPKVPVPETVLKKKTAAKEIFLRVNGGEEVVTTTVHLSEVANVLEDAAGTGFAVDLLSTILLKASIKVETVTADDYRESVAVAEKYSVSVNDALALVVMDRHGIDEIYTFDRHFDRVPVTVVQE